jgi:L-rhamnose isomerase
MEKILNIVDTSFKLDSYYGEFDGFIVTTDKQSIMLGISNYQSCCEDWGYFMSEDVISDFIGADLYDVNVTDGALATVSVPNVYDGDVMFVTLKTSNGDLQFVAYNNHNGYYGHNAVVVSNQVTYSDTL